MFSIFRQAQSILETPRESHNQNEETDPSEDEEAPRSRSPLPLADESVRSLYYTPTTLK